MSRKDVRIGVAVVAVLILVLIVYVLVVPGGKPAAQQAGAQDLLKPNSPAEAVQTEAAKNPVASNEPAAVKDSTAKDQVPTSVTPLADAANKPKDPFGPPDEKWMLALNTGAVPQKVSSDRPAGTSNSSAGKPDTNANHRDTSIGTNSALSLSSPTTRPAGKTHTILAGETLAKIAEQVYGSQVYYRQILAANPGLKPEKLRPGMVINLPDVKLVKADGAADDDTPAPAVDSKTEYRVQSGENLSRIAVKLYGKSEMWEKIYDLNKSRIGDDPAKLKVGMMLQLPTPPTNPQ